MFPSNMLDQFAIFVQVVGSSNSSVKGVLGSEQVYRGILDCFSTTYKEAGIRGLYRGVGMIHRLLFLRRIIFLL